MSHPGGIDASVEGVLVHVPVGHGTGGLDGAVPLLSDGLLARPGRLGTASPLPVSQVLPHSGPVVVVDQIVLLDAVVASVEGGPEHIPDTVVDLEAHPHRPIFPGPCPAADVIPNGVAAPARVPAHVDHSVVVLEVGVRVGI